MTGNEDITITNKSAESLKYKLTDIYYGCQAMKAIKPEKRKREETS
jgi:hypothetical protein